MPIPRLKMSEYKLTKRDKMTNVVIKLRVMGYDIEDPRIAIKIIEDDNLDKSQFDFPYDSFEETKAHVLAGEFDFDESSMIITDERREELRKAVEEGKLWVTY